MVRSDVTTYVELLHDADARSRHPVCGTQPASTLANHGVAADGTELFGSPLLEGLTPGRRFVVPVNCYLYQVLRVMMSRSDSASAEKPERSRVITKNLKRR